MDSTPQFRADLYRGTADDYDRHRVPYPAQLLDDLVTRASLSGNGRLLDLACGPGRVTFALARYFADVVAVDQEEESVSYARAHAPERGAAHVRWQVGRAEDLDIEGPFELVTVGDAFHRLHRHRVATLVHKWLQPAGHVALLWTSMPWEGTAPWQQAASDVVVHWMEVTGSIRNIPSGLADALTEEPHLAVLGRAGLEAVGTYEVT
ncbi:MAG TPA: class I SAM-dependent methyltransferase, partial [Acidimicrobiales bacterium]|nr:class I SAM-dependent methyltransferase [Acidimicrobiales bacterium]